MHTMCLSHFYSAILSGGHTIAWSNNVVKIATTQAFGSGQGFLDSISALCTYNNLGAMCTPVEYP